MTEIMKELLPVVKEAISAGKAIGIWYIIAITIIPLIKTVINWGFVLIIYKGVLSIFNKVLENEKN